jgi:hypothetical protein
VDVRWEGPAFYRCRLDVPDGPHWLVFHGASYEAVVSIDDCPSSSHRGIWDAFAVPIGPGSHEVCVAVTKNGGPAFPVARTLAGFLPYVYHTFGGLFREVELVASPTDPTAADAPPPPSRVRTEAGRVLLDGRPAGVRGVLTWGWYPGLGAPHPSPEAIEAEFRRYRTLGFNLVKFCLWLPPHCAFEALEALDMWAWVELPLWMPRLEGVEDEALAEVERIVRQYRRHSRTIAWTCGCELDRSVSAEFRRRLFELVSGLTGCPLVKDSSGGAEMYGGSPVEFGTFDDYHPYGEPHYFGPMLDSLRPGPRPVRPIMLGETIDYDAYRPLHTIRAEAPFWASTDPGLNDQGVRWQFDLPTASTRRTEPEEDCLRTASLARSRWVRRRCLDTVAACPDVAGYVVTGARDTPISSSGVDEAGVVVSDTEAFLVPRRRPVWARGGNRPACLDPCCGFEDDHLVQVGLRSGAGTEAVLRWSLGGHGGSQPVVLAPAAPTVALTLQPDLPAGAHELSIRLGDFSRTFRLWSVARLDEPADWEHPDYGPAGSRVRWSLPLGPGVNVLDREGTLPCPFWRECVLAGSPAFPWADEHELFAPVAPDCALDPGWLARELPGAEWLLTRVDTRTYREAPYVARRGSVLVTTLRPQGGLGSQPAGVATNAAGQWWLRQLDALCE